MKPMLCDETEDQNPGASFAALESRSETDGGLRAGALTQYIVLRGSMNSERPPESASSTPTGPRGSEGLREDLRYFLFESRPPPPAAEARRHKGWQGRRQGRWQGWWPWRTRPALRRSQRPIYSVRAGGATAAEVRPPATSHGVERRRDGPESRRQVCHDRGREARGDGCARSACAAALNARYSIRAGGATAAELRPPATFPSC